MCADYYTQFCVQLEDLTDLEIAWLDGMMAIDPDEMDDDAFRHWRFGLAADMHLEDPWYWPRFDADWCYKDRKVYLESEESGQPDNVAGLLSLFLFLFRPEQSIVFQVGYTASNLVPDGSGGAAYGVTAKEWECFSPFHFAGLWTMQRTRGIKCPVCGQEPSYYDGLDMDGHDVVNQVRCDACGSEWTEMYVFHGRQNIRVTCSACERLLPLYDHFKEHHVCRGCGKRICDDCYHDNGPTCGAPKCGDWERWERADHEYDSYKCDGMEDRWGIFHGEADDGKEL